MGQSQSVLPDIQSEPIPNYKPVAGEGVPRRRVGVTSLPRCGAFGPECDNLYALFRRAAERHPARPCIGRRVTQPDGTRPFEFIDFETTHKSALIAGSGLKNLGLGRGDGVGIYAANRMEWALSALGAYSQALTTVPLYDPLGEDAVRYEINHAELAVVVVEKAKLKNVAAVAAKCATLRVVVQVEELDAAQPEIAALEAAGVTLIDWAALTKSGAQHEQPIDAPLGSDLAFIMYTSGTTGDPKGVCLTHGGVTMAASYAAGLEVNETDRYLSYLPLAHIFESLMEHGIWCRGGSVGYFGGNVKELLDDVAELRPTIFCGVPRVFGRVYDKAMAGIAAKGGVVRALFNLAMRLELDALKTGEHTALRFLFGPVRAALGGHCRLIVSGAAPLPSHVQDFLRATMGCPVVQGYGMTENCAQGTIAIADDWRGGHVGPPMPTVEVKLVDVPEMGYYSYNDPPAGEVCQRGVPTFKCYHKNPEATAETIDAQGWQHTGDIGRWNADGTLSIIDRKKNIFKLSQGEYVAAEKIEMAVSKSPLVGQVWVYGNSQETCLVCVVVPDFDALRSRGGFDADGDTEALCRIEAVRKLMLSEVTAEATEARLRPFEVPKAVHVEGRVNALGQGFTVENDTMTPTFKLRRPQLLKMYAAQVDAMYESLRPPPDAGAGFMSPGLR